MEKSKKKYAISLFLIIFLSSSYTICNDIWGSVVSSVLWAITAMVLIFESHLLKKNISLVLVVMLGIMALGTIVNKEDFIVFILLLISYCIVALYISQVEYPDFVETYLYVMKPLCIISLIGYMSFLIMPSLHSLISPISVGAGRVTNLVLYVDSPYVNRNFGLFWEPGAFQTFVNLALLFEILKDKFRLRDIVLYVAVILTTYSTTGYIGMILVLGILFLKQNISTAWKIGFMIIVAGVLGFCLYSPSLYSFLFGGSINGQSTVFGKIINFFNSGNQTTLNSAGIRYNAVFEVLKAFFEKPLLGYGYDGLRWRTYEYTQGVNSCTFLNWFATYGIAYGMICTVGVFKWTKYHTSNMLIRIWMVLVLFVLTMSENYIHHVDIMILVLYGLVYSPSNNCAINTRCTNENC